MENKLPKGWAETEFTNLVANVIGGDWGKDPDFEDSDFVEVYCIRGSEIKNWNNNFGDTAVVRKIKKSSLATRCLINGDILLEISGGGPDQPVGRVVLVTKNTFDRLSERPIVCTNFLRLVRPVNHINSNYFCSYLEYFYHSGEVVKYQGGSNNLRNLKYKEYETIGIPLPPLAEQERIVAKLDRLFAQHEKIKKALDRIPQLLKNFRQQVLSQAVTGKLTEQWREGKELGEWNDKVLDDVILKIEAGKNFNCPSVPVSEGKVGLVKISAVTWGYFNENETKTVNDPKKIDKRLFIKKGDFLISRANTLELVGTPVIVESIRYDIMLSDKVWRITFNHDTVKWYVRFFLSSKQGRKEIENRATGNQLSMRNISQMNFKKIPILLPSHQEQQEIVRRVESLFAKADTIEERYKILNEKIEYLPQAILHKAFKGQLVPQFPTDGDAKDLLADIMALRKEVKGRKKK